MKRHILSRWVLAASLLPAAALAQDFNILDFDPTSKGPWSEVGRTTLMVPKVAKDSIKLDGSATDAEYGGFQGVTVTPGVNAWILNFPDDRVWDGPADSSFTFWLAHDDDNFYVGVHAKDDVVNSDNPNNQFWNDDAIELVVDALADRLDNNTDSSKDPVGGHSYVNFQGRFSAWDEATGAKGSQTWASAVDWKYGPNDEIHGSGKQVAGGWQMEVRFRKSVFESVDAKNKLRDGYRMGFNIGLDDDDKKGPGTNGDKSRSQDLEIQYFWANRERRLGLTQEFLDALTPEERASKTYASSLELGINAAGRLAHGGTGEILFGYEKNAAIASKKVLFVTSIGDSPINGDAGLIALLRARGYQVTVFTANGSTPQGLREAAAGKDVVLISETIGSTSVVDPAGIQTGIFSLKDTNVPVISFEAYMWDNADWVKRTDDGSNDWSNWGNSGRSEVPEAIQDARDSLYIQKPGHPIVAGLTGKQKVYEVPYSFNYGLPSADAEVLASIEPDGSFPTLFVYEKGDKLPDGSVVPNKRIGLFVGQAANPNANVVFGYDCLNETGRNLFLNTVAFAAGVGTGGGGDPKVSIARAGGNVTITYSGGALQSTDKLVGGTWANETGASPLTVSASGAAKYYRVRAN